MVPTSVFCGVGGGTTNGMRTVNLAKDAEHSGAMGVVVNAPMSNENIRMVFDEISIKGEIGDTVSILPFSGDVQGVTTKGLEYPLLDSTLKMGTSLGVSNKMTENECCITIKKGAALVIRSND